jgi:type II secretory pathway pseudopilin PulG
MKNHFMPTRQHGQKGLMLLELLVVIAITTIIGGGISMTIFQMLDVNARTTTRMTAVKQVENAIQWLSRDAQMAQVVSAPAQTNGLPLTLSWVDWDGTNYQVNYQLVSSGATKQLQRQYLVSDANNVAISNQTTIPAQFINSGATSTNVQYANGVLSYKITSTVTGFRSASETRTGQFIPRTSK